MSPKPYNIFISWSGERSKHIALGLKDWLPTILQTAKPWMSESDIDKGARGVEEIGKALSDIKIGLVCLTPENLDSRWVLFEAGALSKTLDVKTRLCTYLLGGLEPKDVPQPLGTFQATRAVKDDTKQLIKTINAAIADEPLTDTIIETVFEPLWPKLQKTIETMPERTALVKRSIEDMLAEVLSILRSESRAKMVAIPIYGGDIPSSANVADAQEIQVEYDKVTGSINVTPSSVSKGATVRFKDSKGGKLRVVFLLPNGESTASVSDSELYTLATGGTYHFKCFFTPQGAKRENSPIPGGVIDVLPHRP